MKVRSKPLADQEAAEAAAWYEKRRPGLGDEFFDDLQHAQKRIQERPQSFGRIETPAPGEKPETSAGAPASLAGYF